MGQRIGSMIGAIGGITFVLVNAGAFDSPVSTLLRVVGVAAFLFAIWYAVIRRRPAEPDERPGPRALRTYWLCVIGEVIAIPLGAQLLRLLGLSQLTLTWVIAVVGVHFLPFARAFRVPLFTRLAVALIAVAVLGAVATLTIDVRAAAAAGVAAGFVLLLFAFLGAAPRSGRLEQRA